MKRNLTLLSLIVLCSSTISAQIYRGIGLTGFKHDVIAESNPAAGSTGSVTIDAAGYVLYSSLYTGTVTTQGGLKASGVYTTTTRTYSLASYAGPNALRVVANATDSLSLTTPQSVSVLSLLGFSSGIDALVDVTVKFTDGTSALYNSRTLYNWSSSQPAIIAGFGKTNRTTNAIYYTPTEPKMFSLDIPVACANQSKKISKVLVKNNTNGATVYLFAGAGVGKANFVVSSTPVLCKGTATGTAKALGVDMWGPVSYNWTPGGQTTQTASNLAAGDYTVNITDGNGCSYTKTVTITEPANTFSITSISSTSVACTTGTTGTAQVDVTGGNSPYVYTWNTMAAVSSTSTSNSITSLSSGVYSVTVGDNNGCVLTASTTVAKPSVTISVSTTSLLCGTTANGSATVTSVTGTSGALTYSWVPASQTSSVATGLNAGTYTVLVTDATGCVNKQTTSVSAPDFSLTLAETTCTLSTGSATVSNITGGVGGPYTYSWNPAGGSAATATGLSAGNYTVTVRDNANCPVIKTFNLASVNATLTVATSSLLCGTIANGSATVTAVTGGAGGPFTYTWMPTSQTNSVATGLGAGIYSVTVKGASGCATTQTLEITQPAITIASFSTSCKGLQPTGSATVTSVVGGAAPYTYAWDASTMAGVATGSLATGLDEGSYTVTVTDANNCKISSSFAIVGPTGTAMTAATTASAATCSGINNGKGSITGAGGLAPLTYYWNSNPPQYTQTATGLAAPNVYYASVIDFNGCVLSKSVTIYPEPQNLNIYVCPSNTIVPGANAVLNITGLSGTGTYTWSTGATTSSVMVTPTNTLTVYTLTGTTTSSCIVTGMTTIYTSTTGATSCIVGIAENAEVSYNVYPNPNNGHFVVAFDQMQSNATLEVMDALGKIVLTQQVIGLETTVNTSSLQNGMYFVIVRDENKILMRTKVIRQ